MIHTSLLAGTGCTTGSRDEVPAFRSEASAEATSLLVTFTNNIMRIIYPLQDEIQLKVEHLSETHLRGEEINF